MRILISFVLIFCLFAWLMLQANPNALAAEENEKPKTPQDFIVSELALGSFTAALGWGAATLATSPWHDAHGCKDDVLTLQWCALIIVSIPTITAPLGVFAIGELSGVNGNVPFAVLGTVIAGLALYGCASDPHGAGKTIWCEVLYLGGFGLLLTPTALATIGYNWRAQMKTDSSIKLNFTLPFFSARF